MNDPEPQLPPLTTPVNLSLPEIYISTRTLMQIQVQLEDQLQIEVGGILAGNVKVDEPHWAIKITGNIAATATESSAAHIDFTHASWPAMQRQQLKEFPDTAIVGWYHSHPGKGVFLSTQDNELHSQIFGLGTRTIALVIDPLTSRYAFFWPYNNKIVLLCKKIVLGP